MKEKILWEMVIALLKELRKEKPIFKIRVIKRTYKYTDINHLMSSMWKDFKGKTHILRR